MSEQKLFTRREFMAAAGGVATATAAGPVCANWLPDGADATRLVEAGYRKRFVSCFMCGAGCGLMALEKQQEDAKHVFVTANPTHPQRGYCGRGASALWMWNHPLRLRQPLKRIGERGQGRFVEVSWDVALDEIAARLKAAVAAKGERSVVYTSHDLAALAQVAAYALGTPNVVNHASTCMTPGTIGRRWAFEQPYDHHRRVDPDYENVRYLVLLGRTLQAPMGSSHRLALARASGDVDVVFVDPRRPDNAFATSEWVPIVPGTDAAFVLALVREIIERKLADEAFLAAHTNAPLLIRPDGLPVTAADVKGDKDAVGFAVWDAKSHAIAFQGVKRDEKGSAVAFVADAAADPALDYEGDVTLASGERIKVTTAYRLIKARVARYTPEHAAELTGIDAGTIRRIAQDFAKRGGVMDDGWYWSRNGNDTDVARSVALLNAIVGNIDRKGGLALSRGASLNFIGLNAGTRKVSWPLGTFDLAETKRIDTYTYPEANGTFQAVVDAILTGKPYAVSTLFSLGTTLIHREANVPKLLEAVAKLDLFVVQDLLPHDICDYADYVLPSTFFMERSEIADVKWTLHAALQRSEPVLPMPKGVDARDDLWMMLEVLRRAYPERARLLGYGAEQASSEGYAAYKQQIEQAMLGQCLKIWAAREPDVAPRVDKELAAQGFSVLGRKQFDELPRTKPLQTASGKVEIYALRAVLNPALRKANADPLPDCKPVTAYRLPKGDTEFYVVSGKSMSNGSGSAMMLMPAKATGDRSVWMHPDDARRLGIRRGETIELQGLDTGETARAAVHVTRRVRPRVLFTYAFSGGHRSTALAKDARFAFLREGVNPNRLGPGYVEPVTGAIANNFSVQVRKV